LGDPGQPRLLQPFDEHLSVAFAQPGRPVDQTRHQEVRVLKLPLVGERPVGGLLLAKLHFHLGVPGGKLLDQLAEELLSLLGHHRREGPLDLLGKVLPSDVGALVGEVGLDHAEPVGRSRHELRCSAA